MSLYETIFIVNPNVDETALEEITQSVQSFIESNGGEVKHVDHWGRKKLAYTVQQQTEGYYVYMIFDGSGEIVSPLYRQYQIADGIIKSMTVLFEGDLAQIIARKAEAEAEAVVSEASASEESDTVPVVEATPSVEAIPSVEATPSDDNTSHEEE